MSIPLSVLVQALDALEAVNDYDIKNPLPRQVWEKVMKARSTLKAKVGPLLADAQIEVAA